MVRKFLYFIAIMIVLFIGGAFALNIWSDKLTEVALVPTVDFVEQQPLDNNAYQQASMWFSRPGIGTDDPARWQPAYRGETRDETLRSASVPNGPDGSDPATSQSDASDLIRDYTAPAEMAEDTPPFAVFFVHPTSYINREAWNAPLDDPAAEANARIQIRGSASAFNRASEIWAPRYRQATIGAFLSNSPDAIAAIESAYGDVLEAYKFFLATVDPDTPIVLAGHSQGAAHIATLLKDEIAGTPVADRIAGVYAIGWPISVEHDLPLLGLPACASADQAGCILSWASYAEPAKPGVVMRRYEESTGYDGQLRGDSTILCTNPLTGMVGGAAPASANLGTLVPNERITNGDLVPEAVPARCNERGLLIIGNPPEMGRYVLPGNSYHVYDIPLFWANVQADVTRRVLAWSTRP